MLIIESRNEKKVDGLRGFEKKSPVVPGSSVLTSLTSKERTAGTDSHRDSA